MENKKPSFGHNHAFQQFFKVLSLSLSTISLLAGIIAPMVVIMGMLIYFSWFFFGYPFFSWTLYYLYINVYPSWLTTLIYSIEIIVFLVGLGLLLTALISFLKQKVQIRTTNSINSTKSTNSTNSSNSTKSTNSSNSSNSTNPINPINLINLINLINPTISTNSKEIVSHGIYRFIRHPQNLGISLMLFPLALILPFGLTEEIIRYGDILSWGLSCFFLALVSLYEEKVMLQAHPEAYWAYIQKSGLYFPSRKVSTEVSEYSREITTTYLKKTFFKLLLSYFGFFLGCIGLFYVLKPFMVLIRFPPVYTIFIPLDMIIESYNYDNNWMDPLIPFIVLLGIWIFSLVIVLINNLNKKRALKKSAKIG